MDFLLDIIIVNQSEENMENVYLELAPLGSSARTIVRPIRASLAPFAFVNMKARIKVEHMNA